MSAIILIIFFTVFQNRDRPYLKNYIHMYSIFTITILSGIPIRKQLNHLSFLIDGYQ